MPKRITTSDALTDAQIVAVACSIKDKAVDAAKAALLDGSVTPVDFDVNIRGSVTKGQGTPDAVSFRPAQVTLAGLTVFCAVLRRLGIGRLRLQAALESLPALSALEVDAELSGVFDQVARDVASKLPQERVTTNGKRGSVSASATVAKVVQV